MIASVLDVVAMLVLALVLAVVASIAFLIVASITQYNTRLIVDPILLRGFKGDSLAASIVVIFKRTRWIKVNLAFVSAPPGVETDYKVSESNVTHLLVSSKYAGRFSGLTLNLEVGDILNLFSKKIHANYPGFTFESLPISILAPVTSSRPMPLALGEKSGRSPGSSLELYALDDYQPFTQTKNILWKRVARMPDERLIVRVRDSSVPRVVTIGFVQTKSRLGQARLELIDKACESIGRMANILLATGSMVEIIYSEKSAQSIVTHDVTSIDQLSDVLMSLSDESDGEAQTENLVKIVHRSGIVVCGTFELGDRTLSFPLSTKPTLAINEEEVVVGSFPQRVGQQTMIYTGVEDVRKLVSKVLEA